MSAEALRVVLCWHMHQPEYRDPSSGEYQAPWTYLHAIKDYVDMAVHLETAPAGVKAVVNFPPVLLDQIADYADRIHAHLHDGSDIGDPLLDALSAPGMPTASGIRRSLLERCLQAHEHHMIARFPQYQHLVMMTREALEAGPGPDYLSDRHLEDLLTWYHLAWLGETVHRRDGRVKALVERGQGYGREERQALVAIIGELMAGLLDRYRTLATSGRVELSVSPRFHAMLPLLLDFDCAREAEPDLRLPAIERYPGGEARAAWQLTQARVCAREHLGLEPAGCWPSEGGVSAAALELIGKHGFAWAASGQAVLRNSLGDGEPDSNVLHRPYRLAPDGPVCFFRDDELSDRIGFVYKDWHGDDAVADFVSRLESLAAEGEPGRVVAVILDGENPWEHYPHNGIHFVPALYAALAQNHALQLCTFSECVDDASVSVAALPGLVAGSWVYGTLSTWIGDPDKNRAWELLCQAKAACDGILPSIDEPERRTAIEYQLGVCEGSDWFWWFGDYNPSEAVTEFDSLYRLQLNALYGMLGEPPPEDLLREISRGHGHPELGGTMRRGRR